jgi:hypothetical protein
VKNIEMILETQLDNTRKEREKQKKSLAELLVRTKIERKKINIM